MVADLMVADLIRSADCKPDNCNPADQCHRVAAP